MIVYKDTLNSLLKAAIFSYYFDEMVCRESELQQSLFQLETYRIADEYSWELLIERVRKEFDQDIRWILAAKGDHLKQILYVALRNAEPNKYEVCIKAVQKAFEYSPDWILEQGCQEAKKLFHLYKGVSREIHQLLSFIRFSPMGADGLVAKTMVTHDCLDLLLIRLKQRYPAYHLALITEDYALVMSRDGELEVKDPQSYLAFIEQDDFIRYWDTYYRSQYIPERKNIKHAARLLPKKYWHWIHEGKILLEEERKGKI